ncbi:hypothetical protein D9756_001330 [Leucocoprinus leucothites]|uniref:LIM zinc-binding domain-containing protein n=1 Tax=Leucocoprinus leucothites TaxID=201217 RepID=A0A8H5G4M1_9AGAR|nr:hypothetical protein D9756_001330 [Leucoagaricus leucothites]
MASLLAQSSSQPRVSQVLPSVRCSNCNQPVPLSELGEHVCTKPPPVPAIPRASFPTPLTVNSPRPPSSRIASPGLPVAGPTQRLATPPIRHPQSPHQPPIRPMQSPLQPPIRPPQSPQPPPRVITPSENQPRMSGGPVSPSQPQRSSPLAREARNDTSMSFKQPLRDIQPRAPSSLSPNSPVGGWLSDGRERSQSSASVRGPIPPTDPALSYPGMNHLASVPGSSSIAPPRPMPVASTGQRVTSFVPESEVGIDTKIGGMAGMAGVGRRGFAAAVRAAMFVSPSGYPVDRRPEPPRFLDMDAASRSTDTPPLSAGSGYSSHSPGPLSPGPQVEFIPEPFAKSSHIPSPAQPQPPASAHDPRLPSPVRSPVDEIASGTGLSPLDRLPFLEKYKNTFSGLSTSSDLYFESDKQQAPSPLDRISNQARDNDYPRLRNLSVSTVTSRTYQRVDKPLHHDSDSDTDSEAGLAYADSDDDENDAKNKDQVDPNTQPSSILRSESTSTTRSGKVRFYGEDDSGRSAAIAQALGISPNSSSTSKLGRQRSDSDSSADTRSVYSRTTSIGPISGPIFGVAFDPTMETVEEEIVIGGLSGESPEPYPREGGRHLRGESRDQGIGFTTMSTSVQPHRSNTVQVPPHSPENKPPKLPTRAKTTNDHHKSLLEPPVRKEKSRRVRVCLRCEKKIEDGRWIKVDTGGALCEKCWKNMYLPKCRRCQLPIEKQAVSSSDGQLKGKYHKECFNCHVCHQPFPDKSFYVYDGKPLCAYHYHEANDSLCAAARCGQPIEGPCAVSHAGDKYHPEHMTCEHPGSIPCDERLNEYWEVEGRMLCEKHAASAGNGEDNDEEWTQTYKAQKRVTRFMNLTGGELSDLL